MLAVVRAHFKPEFLNRLDDIVVFHALDHRGAGARSSTSRSTGWRRRLADRRLTLEVTDAAREWLAMTGYDPVYGARPLRRLVQTAIGDQLAKALLAGEIRDGDPVLVDLLPDRSGLSVAPATAVTV